MKVTITKKRLLEIIAEELDARLTKEQKDNPEFAKYLHEALKQKFKLGEQK